MLRVNTQIPVGSANETVDTASGASDWPGLPAEYYETRWYVAQTSANHEKRVAEQLSVRAVENFLPLYASRRQWKDRRITLELPLFPGYVFVHLALRDRLRAVQVPGVAKLVGFGGTPAPLSNAAIEGLRSGLASRIPAEPCAFLAVGRRVRVKHGPMMGLQGILARRKSHTRLVVSLELIQRAVAVEIDETELEPVA